MSLQTRSTNNISFLFAAKQRVRTVSSASIDSRKREREGEKKKKKNITERIREKQ